jgi:hypothetical protein
MKLLTIACIFLAWPFAATSAQVTMSASTQTATIAEHVELRLIVRTLENIDEIKVTIPAGGYDIISRQNQPRIQTAEWRTFEQVITIAFFKTGDFTVGPLAIELLSAKTVKENETSGTVTIKIRSLLGENDKDIKPLKKLLVMRGDPRHLLIISAGVMILLLLLIMGRLLLKKMKKKRLPETAPLLAPEIELEMRIRELRQKNLPQLGEFRQFFISLSDMIKHFLERAYEFNAADFTTAETVAGLKKSEKDGEIIAHLETIFRQADFVKFARQIPEKEVVAGIFQKIAALIEKHKNRREQAKAETHAQTGR